MRHFTLLSITWAVIAGSVLSALWLAAADSGAPYELGAVARHSRDDRGSRSAPQRAASAQRQGPPAPNPPR